MKPTSFGIWGFEQTFSYFLWAEGNVNKANSCSEYVLVNEKPVKLEMFTKTYNWD